METLLRLIKEVEEMEAIRFLSQKEIKKLIEITRQKEKVVKNDNN